MFYAWQSVFCLAGSKRVFEIDNSMSNLFETRGQIVKSIIYYIGSVSLLKTLFGKVYIFLSGVFRLEISGL